MPQLERDVRHTAIELNKNGMDWGKVQVCLMKEFRGKSTTTIHKVWSDVKTEAIQGTHPVAKTSPLTSAVKTNDQLPSAVPDLNTAQPGTTSAVPKEIHSDNVAPDPKLTGEPISEKHSFDVAWYGLSLLVPELKRGWYRGDLAPLGRWRPRGTPGLKPGDIAAVKEFASKGGHGDFLLEKPAVEAFLRKHQLDPERVLTDLWDRGVLIGDSDHVTRVKVIDGKRRRVLVLPDRHVTRRNPKYLPSALRKKHGRAAQNGASV